jgi:hypothetical protein
MNLSIISHEVLDPLVPSNPRADSLAIDPEGYSKQADSKKARAKNIEHLESSILCKPRVDEVRLQMVSQCPSSKHTHINLPSQK